VDSLDNKIPIGRARNWVAATCPIFRSNGEQRGEFQGAAVRKATATDGCAAQKVGSSDFARIRPGPAPQSHLPKAVSCARLSGLLVSTKRAATNSTNFASVWRSQSRIPPAFSGVNNLLWPVMACANDTFGSSHCASCRRMRDAAPSQEGREPARSFTLGARVRRGASRE
jgi:hypothetical protein